jgi:D-sedoheptulose 7-phosphate isomerase
VNDVHNVRDYKSRLIATLERLDDREVNAFIDALAQALSEERAIFIFGNGGSAATASHMTCDLNKGCSYGRDRRFKVICLNDNLPTMMAYANDVSYHDIFVEPLKNFLRPGDLVIGISGSGNSENVLRAIDYANANGALTVGLCGYSGGKLKQKAGIVVHVAVDDMQIAEDVHLVLGHMAMQALAGRSCC